LTLSLDQSKQLTLLMAK